MKIRFGWALASAMLLGGIGSASAADMAVKAPPMAPVPVWNWTGFYVGGNVGGIWPDRNGVSHSAIAGPCNAAFPGCALLPNFSSTVALGSTFNTSLGNSAGFTGGGQFGYNWQFNGRAVAGFEADIAWTDQNRNVNFASSTANPVFGPGFPQLYTAAVSSHLDYLGTVRGRLGFLAAPSFLLYGTGGLAYGGTRSSTVETSALLIAPGNVFGNGGGSSSQVRVGWTAGVGGEWMLGRNWSAKVEYLYYDLGTVNYATALSGICVSAAPACAVSGGIFSSTTGTTSLRYAGSIARVGLNYHFGGPVVAKY
jgi:outer membrane immunogenic protein